MINALMPAVRTAFSAASLIAPGFTADIALRLFSTPGVAGGLSPEQKRLADAAEQRLATSEMIRLEHAAGQIQAYRFKAGSRNSHGGAIVLVHGWTGSALYMLGFVDPLNALGFDVVCFDLPAHGRSTGRRTNLRECANALRLVVAAVPDVYGIVAHSFGGPVTALALDGVKHPDIRRIALLAVPDAAADMIQVFGGALGLHSEAQTCLETEFASLCACPMGEFTGTKFFSRINIPLLVLHGRSDQDVPFKHGSAYRTLPNCRFVALDSIGHRDILSSAKAIRRVSKFMEMR
jgi:pimeloyl-ACP methyl ester carboxylesterase